MRPLPLRVLSAWAVATAAASGGEGDAPTPESAAHFEDAVLPVLTETCGDCHAADDPDNHVGFLTAATADDLNADRGLWKNVAEQLRNRTMPPADSYFQPTEDQRREVADWVDRFLRETACDAGPHAGPVVARRLNRHEYDNTLRDLLGVDLHLADAFPADGAGGEGFDNNGETLFTSPILFERYLTATTTALDAAVWTPRLEIGFGPDELLPQSKEADHVRTLPPGGEVAASLPVYLPGDYTVLVKADAPGGTAVTVSVDGVKLGDLPLDDAGGVPPRAKTVVHLERGRHLIVAANPGGGPLPVRQIKVWDHRDGPPGSQKASHRLLLGLDPGARPEDVRGHVRDRLATLARRGFRRPVSGEEVDGLMRLYDRAADRGDPWEEGFKLAARGVLLSPKFLFRTEPPPRDAAPGEPAFVGDHALAARLSYFLWASMPDGELDELADAGRLSDPAVLDDQVDRMLADPRAAAFADRFAGQWLGTSEVGGRVAPDVNRFRKIFSPDLLSDLRRQPAELFLYLLREDRPLTELIAADYAVLNDRLAIHYGLKEPPEKLRGERGKYGPRWLFADDLGLPFRRFDLPERDRDRRGGALGLGGVLLASSYSQRTSPVLRGAWVLETLLGTKVPPPPPDVPELKVPKNGSASVREKLARHRDDPACAACHNLMDPVGFALDNYDVLGRWREKDGQAKVDASATLPTGESFEGPGGLRKVLLAREDRVVRHLTAKLLGYALGRSLEDGDDCTIDRIAAEVAAHGGSTRTLVKAVARSVPFRMVARDASDER